MINHSQLKINNYASGGDFENIRRDMPSPQTPHSGANGAMACLYLKPVFQYLPYKALLGGGE